MNINKFPSYLILGIFLFLSSSLSPSLSHELQVLPPSRRLLQSSLAEQFLTSHNIIRVSLNLPLLRWNSTLVNYAAWWANQRKGDCALAHSDSNYGENIFWGGGSNWQVGDAVAIWAAERRYYDYNSNSCKSGQDCSHYTQMVWKQSARLGCARVVCASGDTFVTCNYDPHGNVIGKKPY
ncbi:pathogenesis-related protein PRB1-3-like [Typha angustifolia]|uniref:pathogenesis-related protein PRB1-3-like n=1 Tax=Typha angustifolia TaxID=59011 RepID=UPI003C2DF4A6